MRSVRSRGTERIRGQLTTGETECQRQFWIKEAQKNCDLEQDRAKPTT